MSYQNQRSSEILLHEILFANIILKMIWKANSTGIGEDTIIRDNRSSNLADKTKNDHSDVPIF